jgi:hypothetical protein
MGGGGTLLNVVSNMMPFSITSTIITQETEMFLNFVRQNSAQMPRNLSIVACLRNSLPRTNNV